MKKPEGLKRAQSQKQLMKHMNANNKIKLVTKQPKCIQIKPQTQAAKKIAVAHKLFRDRQKQSRERRNSKFEPSRDDQSFRRLIDPRQVEQFVFDSQILEYEIDQAQKQTEEELRIQKKQPQP